MNVGQLMKSGARSCSPRATLEEAAQIMFENDCGCVVIKEAGHLVGMLTDRDICMAAYFQGAPLSSMLVGGAMTMEVFTCRPDDSIASAEATMREHQVRRLPVVAAGGDVVGILSLNDIAGEAARQHNVRKEEVTFSEVGETLRAVCQPRPRAVATLR